MKPQYCLIILVLTIYCATAFADESFRVATYNIENYLSQQTESRPHPKSVESKAKVCESIEAIKPDVIAIQEIGTTNDLMELRASLKADGLDFPYWEHVTDEDTNIHLAILSRLPIVARRPHTNDQFLLDGRPFRVERGFAEVDIQLNTNFIFTLITAHLKSRRTVPNADEAEERFEEAKILRGIIDSHFKADPNVKLIVLGDFNDLKNSNPTREIMGRGKFRLVDTRPAERNGDNEPNPNPRFEPRDVTWTHYYGIEDTYSRIDYILLSPAMVRYWVKGETYIPMIPNWGIGSDHRPIVAAFRE